MARVSYSQHAKERLTLRSMTKGQVISALREPDRVYEDISSSTTVAVKKARNRYIVVVYSEMENEDKRVVTVYYASDVERLIRRKVERGIWRNKS